MNHESDARKIHRRGYGCSYAVYSAFQDVNPYYSSAPVPRSEGGKCGAVLAAGKVLKETGTGKTELLERLFSEQFGTLKCSELICSHYDCNEFVGTAARIADRLMEEQNGEK